MGELVDQFDKVLKEVESGKRIETELEKHRKIIKPNIIRERNFTERIPGEEG